MSFLDDTKNFGLIMLILGLIATVSALGSIIDCFGNEMHDLLLRVGQLIYALIILTFGIAVRGGKILLFKNLYDQGVGSKFGVLATFITVLSAANIILGALGIVNHFLPGSDTLAAGAVNIVVGIILLIIAMFMKDGATTTMDKIIWIVLAIVFILGIIGSFISIFAVGGELLTMLLGLVVAICYTLMYLMLFVYLISDEVKAKMGM